MGYGGNIRMASKAKVEVTVKGLRSVELRAKPANGTGGYTPTCRCYIIDGDDAGKMYINEGTYASCLFKQVTTS
jgi:hypothetical protein